MSEYLLETIAIRKSYGEVKANCGVDLRIRPRSIHALIGENGAGKSTLVNVIYGTVKPDSGRLLWRGQSVAVEGPHHARRLGIGIVFQHFALFDTLTAAENIALGIGHRGGLDELAAQIRSLSERYGLAVEPSRPVGTLSTGEKQRVEIVRCLLQSPQLLIMDEPTSVLTPPETRGLFNLLRHLAAEGKSILFISHKLDEVTAICDEATILRQGKTVHCCRPAETNRAEIVRMMVGELGESLSGEKRPLQESETAMEARRLILSDTAPFPLEVESLALRKGVITGIAGIAGNGQDSLLDALSGEMPAPSESVFLEGKPIGDWGVRRRNRSGVLAVPTERHGRAAVAEMTLAENTLLGGATLAGQVRRGLVDSAAADQFAGQIIDGFQVLAPGPAAAAGGLSGGNLQKFIMGRAILQKPKVLLAANPTWGVDVRAALFIRRALARLRDEGCAVLLISEDLDELFLLCDEIAVINRGRLAPPQPVAGIAAEDVGAAMTRAA